MSIDRFFKDKNGEVILYQRPNLLISVWLFFTVIDMVFLHGKYQPVRILSTAVLFAWAYDELRRGDTLFRKTLGAVVLLSIVIMAFLR